MFRSVKEKNTNSNVSLRLSLHISIVSTVRTCPRYLDEPSVTDPSQFPVPSCVSAKSSDGTNTSNLLPGQNKPG